MSTGTERVTKAIMDCEGVAFDGCHKVFILMDKAQMEKMRRLGYGDRTDIEKGDSRLMWAEDTPRSEMYDLVKEWYAKSCELKFIQSIKSTDDQEEFGNIVSQEQRWRP